MQPQDTPRDRTCEERIADHMAGRLDDFRVLSCIADMGEADETEGLEELLEKGRALGVDAGDLPPHSDDLREAAMERLSEYPLGVSSYRTFRIDLSTGGPGDWLEITCSGDTPLYEPAGEGEHYDIETIRYHFADWFDHAERTLDGDDFENARRFAEYVVPELVS